MKRPSAGSLLWLLIWKNWLLVIRKPYELFRNLIIPVILISAMVLARSNVNPVQIPGREYNESDIFEKPDNRTDFQVQEIAFYPKAYGDSMVKITNRLGLRHPIGFNEEQEMIDFIKSGYVGTRAGISFKNVSTVLQVGIHMYTKDRWFQNALWVYPRIGIKDHDLSIGSSSPNEPAYYVRGFILLQACVFEALFKSRATFPSVSISRMPVRTFVYDEWVTDLFIYALGFVAIFYFSFQRSIMIIVQEKESALKELMLITGLPNFLNWMGYMFLFIIENFIYITMGMLCWCIPISSEYAIFPKTNPGVLLLFLVFHAFSLSSFGMFISNVFPTSNKITVLGIGLFLALTFPLYSGADFREKSWAQNWAVLLFPPSTLGVAVKTFLVFEDMGLGMQFQYLNYPPGGTAFCATTLLVALLLQTILFMILTMYFENVIPGNHGAARHWYYPFEGMLGEPDLPNVAAVANKMDCHQEPPPNAKPGILLYNLTKTFSDDFVAVNNISTVIYENEITVLLGENGSGKSTMIAMLSGMVAPTSGTAVFKNKFDLFRNLKYIRKMTGLCPQRTILFPLLTTEEHLVFFARLKGMDKAAANAQAEAYMRKVDMVDKAHTLSSELSGGQQRKLNLGIALAGGTEVIFLDEPTAGVDPAARREIWRILQEERATKMIVMSTHFMDEADMLGDRVMVLHKGELKCAGSTYFLKEKFESTYTLTCFLTSRANVDEVTMTIRRTIPDVTVKAVYGQEVSYDLSPSRLGSFGDLFRNLENVSEDIGVESFAIDMPGMESVFLKITREVEPPTEYKKLALGSTRLVTGFMLFISRLAALFKKRAYYNWRNPFTTFLLLFLPLLVFSLFIARVSVTTNDRVALTLKMYDQQRICLLEAEPSVNAALILSYKKELEGQCELQVLHNVTNYVLRLKTFENYDFLRTALIGARFKKNHVVAIVNNEAAQVQPIALTAVYNAMIKAYIGRHERALQFVSAPIPYSNVYGEEEDSTNMGLLVMCGMLTYASLFGLIYMEERRTGALRMQFVSGYHPICFWLWSFVHDMLIATLAIAMLTAAVGLYLDDFDRAGHIAGLLLASCFGVLPVAYLIAANTTDMGRYLSKFVLAGVVGFVLGMIMVGEKSEPDYEMTYEPVLLLFVFYNVMATTISVIVGEVDLLFVNYTCFAVCGVFCLLLIMLHDMHDLEWFYRLNPFLHTTEERVGKLDLDVQDESDMVDALTKEQVAQRLLVAQHLRQSYPTVTAVKDVTFAMDAGECVGLLGRNGAGKTTAFRLLTGEERIMQGDAFVRGISVKTDLLATYRYFGYCPQTDPLLEDLKASEWLDIVCQIRGVPGPYVKDIYMSLAHELGFDKEARKKVSTMTPSFKRKLSVALALLGEPDLVYLDEPTTGLDPSAKRCVWNTLTAYRGIGKSIVLTSHSMDECEALCTRMIIMYEGKMEAIATGYQLKQKYSKTGNLIVYIENDYALDPGNLRALKAALGGQVMGFVLKQEYEGRLECEYDATERLSKLFSMMQSIKAQYHIEGYAISNQNSLVSIFLDRTGRGRGK